MSPISSSTLSRHTTAYDGIKQFWLPATALFTLSSLVILLGGVQMLRLKSRGLSMTASIMAMIPCFASACCVIGIPVGIWALVVLGSPDVKAAFAAGGRLPATDDYDPR